MSKLKTLCGPLTALLAILLVALPVLAACYAYIYIEESDGNSYDDLPLICPCNITQLADSGFISSTGLDTRVLTGDGYPLPHMLANDKILFVTDLGAYEDKTLIFYTGASSLSSFPIIVGQGGYVTTADDPDLELGWVLETLYSGSFDASGETQGPIHYKEDVWKVSISAANTLRVAALEAGDVEQWEMHYSSFTSGDHTIYIVANGLVAYLYVDDFEVAKDTANLFDSTSYQCINKNITHGYCFYDEGYYWIFYYYDSTHLAYITSADGVSWSGETTIALDGGDSVSGVSHFNVKMRGEYVHIVYANNTGNDTLKYRRGDLTSAPGITWSAGWQLAYDSGGTYTVTYPLITVDSGQYPYIVYEYHTSYEFAGVTKSSANDGTWSTAGGYPFQLYSYGSNNGILQDFAYYPSSNKLLLLWDKHGYDTYWDATFCKYYNGSSWEPEDDISSYITDIGQASMAADENDNMYIGWSWGSSATQRLTVRYDGEVWETIDVNSTGIGCPHVSFNEDNGVLYILYGDTTGTNYVYCATLDTNEMELNTPVPIVPLLDVTLYGVSPYEDHIGFLLYQSPNTYHGYVDLTAYQWNDNANNWMWMAGDCMNHADDLQMAIDGTLQLEYKADTIIQGTTLPDEESDHDGIITWGSNPSGVAVSHSELMCEEEEGEEGSGYYYFEPGSEDIIKPDPMAMTGDVDLEALRDNPLYPLAQVLAIDGFLTERLAWLGIAWFITILAMFAVHMGFEHKPNTKKPEHFVLTTIAGLGLSILFYVWGIFDLWVIILMSFGFIAAIIWERQPVI